MREILFRGKNKNKIVWCVGGLLYDEENDKALIAEHFEDGAAYLREVFPETVGQYTGLTDKNGKKIFEGDIVTGLFLFGMPIKAVVVFKDGSFGLGWSRGGTNTFNAFTSLCNVEYEVIGNVFDNPDLIGRNRQCLN